MEELLFSNPNYFLHEAKLQIVFPEEIWLLIFTHISDSGNYHGICAASPYFHKLLLPLRTRILFPEVINLCTKNVDLTKEMYASILHCRLACKTWTQGVDTTFHHILSDTNRAATDWKFFAHASHTLNCQQTRIMYQPKFLIQSYLDSFLKTFHNSHFLTGSNPFPSRSIYIEIRSRSAIRSIPGIPFTVYSKLFDVLKIYGHHIWHCYVKLWYHNLRQMQREVRIFCRLLGHLPHLQTLRIEHLTHMQETPEYLEDIRAVLTANPLPKLGSLKLLAYHNITRSILSQLIQDNPHIIKLRISELDAKHSALLSTSLSKLEELHILHFLSGEDCLQLKSAQVQWPLKKLTILCHPDISHVYHVFDWIDSQWSDTLTDLNIAIPSSIPVSEEKPLKLLNLKNLRIKLGRYVCLDFVLSLSKLLVSLSVYHEGRDQYGDGLEINSKIKFFSHRENLGQSNIWKFFPKLRYLKYADDGVPELSNGRSYTRNHWVRYAFEGI